MEVTVYTAVGAEARSAELPDSVFDGTVNENALHSAVTAILAHRRQGTAATKNRALITGGGRKPWRQKGTGRARAGTVRSPLWRGGATTFGPQPRDYALKVPKKLRRLAIRSALNARAMDGGLALIESLEMEAPKTSAIAALVSEIDAEGLNVLLLTAGLRQNVYLSARNIAGVEVRPWGQASAYDVLWADVVLVESTAFEAAADDDAGDDDEGDEG